MAVNKKKIHAKYCPNCDGNSTVKTIGTKLTHFKCDECGRNWSRHTSDLYIQPNSTELRLDPEKCLARTWGKKIGNFGGPLTKEIEINGKKYQFWGYDTKSKASANHYADQLRRTGKDVIVTAPKGQDHGWMIFARKRPGRKIGSFGAPMPKSTAICKYCKHFYSRNLPGGWCESGCTKYGWKPDSQGSSGPRLGPSYQKCQGNGFEYVQRTKRLVPVPKPDWVE